MRSLLLQTAVIAATILPSTFATSAIFQKRSLLSGLCGANNECALEIDRLQKTETDHLCQGFVQQIHTLLDDELLETTWQSFSNTPPPKNTSTCGHDILPLKKACTCHQLKDEERDELSQNTTFLETELLRQDNAIMERKIQYEKALLTSDLEILRNRTDVLNETYIQLETNYQHLRQKHDLTSKDKLNVEAEKSRLEHEISQLMIQQQKTQTNLTQTWGRLDGLVEQLDKAGKKVDDLEEKLRQLYLQAGESAIQRQKLEQNMEDERQKAENLERQVSQLSQQLEDSNEKLSTSNNELSTVGDSLKNTSATLRETLEELENSKTQETERIKNLHNTESLLTLVNNRLAESEKKWNKTLEREREASVARQNAEKEAAEAKQLAAQAQNLTLVAQNETAVARKGEAAARAQAKVSADKAKAAYEALEVDKAIIDNQLNQTLAKLAVSQQETLRANKTNAELQDLISKLSSQLNVTKLQLAKHQDAAKAAAAAAEQAKNRADPVDAERQLKKVDDAAAAVNRGRRLLEEVDLRMGGAAAPGGSGSSADPGSQTATSAPATATSMVPPKPTAADATGHSGGSGSINTTSIKTNSINTHTNASGTVDDASIKPTSINTHTNAVVAARIKPTSINIDTNASKTVDVAGIKPTDTNTHTNVGRIVNVGAEARPANWSTSDLSFTVICPGGQCPLQTRPCDTCQYFRFACRDPVRSDCRLQPSSFEQQMTIVVENITSYTYAPCDSDRCKSLIVRCVNGSVSVSASPQAYNLDYIGSKFTYTIEPCSGPGCGNARMCDDEGHDCRPLAPPKDHAPAPLSRQGAHAQIDGQQPGRQQPSQAGPSPRKGRPTASGSDEDDSCHVESPSASGVSIPNNVKPGPTGPENQGVRGSLPKASQPGPGSQGTSGSPDNKGQPPRGSDGNVPSSRPDNNGSPDNKSQPPKGSDGHVPSSRPDNNGQPSRGSDGQTPSSSPSNQGRPSGPESHGAPVSSDKNPSSKGSGPAPQGHVAPPSGRHDFEITESVDSDGQNLETSVTESINSDGGQNLKTSLGDSVHSGRHDVESSVTEAGRTTTLSRTSGSSKGGNALSDSTIWRPQAASSSNSPVLAGGRAASSPGNIVSAGSNAHVSAFTSLVAAVAVLALAL